MNTLRPSKAATWMTCPGHPRMVDNYPYADDSENNDVRDDGIAAHWAAQQPTVPPVGTVAPNGRTVTQEMVDAVELYRGVVAGCTLEQTITCDTIAPGMVGTPDAFRVSFADRHVFVADFKYGFRYVDAYENWQMLCYLAALTDKLPRDDAWTFELAVVQPRGYHRDGPVRRWRGKLSDVRAHFNLLRAAAAECMKSAAECRPSHHCRDCSARHACEAFQQTAMDAVHLAYGAVPMELPPAALGAELALLREAQAAIEARLSGLEAIAEATLRDGKVIPGWSLERSYGRTRWRDGADKLVLALGPFYGVDLRAPAVPVSPSQAKRLLPATLVDSYTTKSETGYKLKKVAPNTIRKIIGD